MSITRPFVIPDYGAPYETARRDRTILNQNQLDEAQDFFAVGNNRYSSLDPRLIDSMRGTSYQLDRPPYETRYNGGTRNVDDPGAPVCEQTYPSYQDINGGQIFYYVDKQFREPYFSPLFQIRAEVTPFIYKDPMGSLKPQFDRRPIVSPQYISDYRHDQDEIYFREDMIANFMQKRNQTDYSVLYDRQLPLAYDPDDGLSEYLL